MQTIDKNCRFTVHDNELWAGFMDWVVFIKPEHVGNGLLLRWSVIFSEGTGGEALAPIYCKTLEQAFEIISHYRDIIHFEDLAKKIFEDQNLEN